MDLNVFIEKSPPSFVYFFLNFSLFLQLIVCCRSSQLFSSSLFCFFFCCVVIRKYLLFEPRYDNEFAFKMYRKYLGLFACMCYADNLLKSF